MRVQNRNNIKGLKESFFKYEWKKYWGNCFFFYSSSVELGKLFFLFLFCRKIYEGLAEFVPFPQPAISKLPPHTSFDDRRATPFPNFVNPMCSPPYKRFVETVICMNNSLIVSVSLLMHVL